MGLLAESGAAGPHLVPDLATFVQTAVLFALLVGILWKFAWPQILHALEERERHIRDEIGKAERARAEGERVLQEYQRKLDAARSDALKIIEEGKADALHLKDRILKDAREEGERLLSSARREIQLAEAKAVETLHRQTVELATLAAARILERNLRPEDHREIVERFVQETTRSFPQGGA